MPPRLTSSQPFQQIRGRLGESNGLEMEQLEGRSQTEDIRKPADRQASPRYVVRRVEQLPNPSLAWEDPAWTLAETLTISRFYPRGQGSPASDHTPLAQLRVLYDGQALGLLFRVEDRYVLARHTAYQAATHLDSCVEAFLRPRSDCGYFNLEFNAIGALLLWYVDKPRRPDGSFESYVEIPEDLARTIEIRASLPQPIHAEFPDALTWTLSAQVPLALFEAFVGPLGSLSGAMWRANFYKCADACSHPHWGSWADIGDRLDFHQPDRFGKIIFA
jgi:hypothetical protein